MSRWCWKWLGTAALLIAVLATVGCAPRRVPPPSLGEEGGPAPAGDEGPAPDGEPEQPQSGSLALEVFTSPAKNRWCAGEQITFDVFVRRPRGMEKTIIVAVVPPDGVQKIIGDLPHPAFQTFFKYVLRRPGDHPFQFRAFTSSGEWQAEQTVNISVVRCPYRATMNYRGSSNAPDGPFTFSEAAAMAPVELTAPPDGPYTGTGTLTAVVTGGAAEGPGQCWIDPPIQGSGQVSITGELDEESGVLKLELGLPSVSGGTTTTVCSAFGMTMPMGSDAYEMADLSQTGLAELTFPAGGGTYSQGTGQSLVTDLSGGGTFTVTVVPVQEAGG